jgi:hypothetical protein
VVDVGGGAERVHLQQSADEREAALRCGRQRPRDPPQRGLREALLPLRVGEGVVVAGLGGAGQPGEARCQRQVEGRARRVAQAPDVVHVLVGHDVEVDRPPPQRLLHVAQRGLEDRIVVVRQVAVHLADVDQEVADGRAAAGRALRHGDQHGVAEVDVVDPDAERFHPGPSPSRLSPGR